MLRYHAHAHSTVLVVEIFLDHQFPHLHSPACVQLVRHQTAKVRARNLMKKDGKDRFLTGSELMEGDFHHL